MRRTIAEALAQRAYLGPGEVCQVCGTAYLTVYRLPDEVWALITPKPDTPEAGLLCVSCADNRARAVGINLGWRAAALADGTEAP